MGFTFSLKMVGTKILVPRSWYQDLWGNRSLHDGGTALSANPNRYPFVTVRTPQASLVGEKHVATRAPCDVFDPWVRWERGQVGI